MNKTYAARPLYATPRTRDSYSEGPLVATVARALGTPLMPWQRQVADVAGELLPDGSYRYPIVVVSVPRQSGKTTLVRARGVSRCVTRTRQEVFYTAQTGKDARERWRDLVKQINASPLASITTTRQSAGGERLVFPNGSEFRVFAPVPTALHGYTPQEVTLDEAWAHDQLRGEELMGAIVPAQITVRDRQLWIVSTAGTADSAFLRQWWDAAIEGQPGVAGFIWAAPEGADPYDPATWRTFHPALGHTITERDLQAAADTHSRAEFERAYCNRWTRTSDAIIPADRWAALGGPQERPAGLPVLLGWDVAHDRTRATIVASWRDALGVTQVKVVRHDAGTDWVPDALHALADALHPAGIAAPGDGPARTIIDAMAGTNLADRTRVLTLAEYANACGEFLADAERVALGHDGTAQLAQAVADAVTRPMGDLWGWSRRNSKGPIDALVAATVAAWLTRHQPDHYRPFIQTRTDAGR